MITAVNTRFQVIPFYKTKKDWFIYNHDGIKEGAYITVSSGRCPAFQVVDESASISSVRIRRIDNISNMLGSSTLMNTFSAETVSFDLWKTGTDQNISTFIPFGNTFIASEERWYYAEYDIGGATWISEPFYVGCTEIGLERYKIEWYNTCNTNNAYYEDDIFKNELWLPDGTVFNAPTSEDDVTKNSNGEIRQYKTFLRYSFTKYLPDYIYHAIKAMNAVDTIILTDYESNISYNLFDVQINNDSGEKSDIILCTVSYRIKEDVYPDTTNCCTDIEFLDEELSGGGGGGGSCPDFAITINESGGELTYSIDSEPASGTLVVAWSKDGLIIGSGSTVSLGGYGNYKITARKDGCTVTDTYSYLNPCENFFLEVTQNLGVISANVSGNTSPVSYKVYDPDSIEVATSLPYTSVVDGPHTVEAYFDDCVRTSIVVTNSLVDCGHTSVIVRANDQLTGSSSSGSAVLTWQIDEGAGFSFYSSDNPVTITKNGVYKLIADVGGCIVESTKLILDHSISIHVDNSSEFWHGCGEIQTITGVSGTNFEFEYQDIRWLVKRNGVDLVYVSGTPTAALEYTVIDGELVLPVSFPLDTDETIIIRPV